MMQLGYFNPRRVAGANLKGALVPARRVALLSNMQVTGTGTPPAVTLSGVLTQARGVYLECTTGGSRGSTVWKHCLDFDGTTSLRGFTTGVAGVAVINLGLGLDANLPDSTYTAGDKYRGVLSTVTGPYGTVWDGSSASESVRSHIGYINGRPTIRSNGSTRYLRSNNSTLADAIVMGNDLPHTIAGVFRYNGSLTPLTTQTLLGFYKGSAGSPGFYDFSVSPAGAWRVGKRGDTGGTNNVDGGTANNSANYFVITHTGTSVSLRVGGSAVFTSQGQDVPSIAGSESVIGLGFKSVAGVSPNDTPGDVDWGDLYMWNSVLSSVNIDIVEKTLKNVWGL